MGCTGEVALLSEIAQRILLVGRREVGLDEICLEPTDKLACLIGAGEPGAAWGGCKPANGEQITPAQGFGFVEERVVHCRNGAVRFIHYHRPGVCQNGFESRVVRARAAVQLAYAGHHGAPAQRVGRDGAPAEHPVQAQGRGELACPPHLVDASDRLLAELLALGYPEQILALREAGLHPFDKRLYCDTGLPTTRGQGDHASGSGTVAFENLAHAVLQAYLERDELRRDKQRRYVLDRGGAGSLRHAGEYGSEAQRLDKSPRPALASIPPLARKFGPHAGRSGHGGAGIAVPGE